MGRPEHSHFEPFVGQHCETVATGTLLKSAGIEFSEPLLFGLGEGLSFIFVKLKTLPLPFIGGRVKPFELTRNVCRNLGVDCNAVETTSRARAWELLEAPLRRGQPVGLQLDSYYLEYFTKPFHFAGHFVAAYGCDESSVFLVDTAPQGTLQKSSRASVEAARFAKGPMAARARTWTLSRPESPLDLPHAVRGAIRANAAAYLSPSFQGMSHLGIGKLAASLPRWLELAREPDRDLEQMALLMEQAGTGGSIFRNFYRDFLSEAGALLPAQHELLEGARRLFAESATEWAAVAGLLREAARTAESEPLRKAAQSCRHIAELEVSAMQLLSRLD